MKKIKLDRKSCYTRQTLRQSLVGLMKEKPIAKITIKELCKNANINRTTFYTHYQDQYGLLQQMEEEIFVYLDDILKKYEEKRSRGDLLQMLTEILEYIAGNSNSIHVLFSENGDFDFQKKTIRKFIYSEQVMKYLIEKSRDTKATEYFSVFQVNGALGLIQHWLKSSMDIPAPDLAKLLVKLTQQSG